MLAGTFHARVEVGRSSRSAALVKSKVQVDPMKGDGMFQVQERVTVRVFRDEPDFDRACDSAYQLALSKFGADRDGYLTAIDHPGRDLTLVVKFKSYRKEGDMHGQTDIYEFDAWASKGRSVE